MRETLLQQGLPSSFYSDRGSHYWITPKAGGRVNKHDLTQFGRAMQELGIHMIPSCCNRSVVPVRGGSQGLPNGD